MRLHHILFIALLVSLGSCKKYLDQKPSVTDVIPGSLDDLQRLLDQNTQLNSNSNAALGELMSDNYYITDDVWQAQSASSNPTNLGEAGHYIWAADAMPISKMWNDPYMGPIYYSNIVLDQLPLITYSPTEQDRYDAIKGAALFYRAYAFFELAQLYCRPFSADNASLPGIVLRLTSNVSAPSTRATVQETYDQIVADLKSAAELLPATALFPTRPSKPAAFAALSRVYLSMRDYANAGNYAGKALEIKNELLDYNTITPVGPQPIGIFNKEVIFHSYSPNGIILGRTRAKIDSTLYKSYHNDDLRKPVFFNANTGANAGTYSFKGSYVGTTVDRVFAGLATDEIYLTRAECYARAGNTNAALADLNTLMQKRWRAGLFTPITATDATDALAKILAERRKELVYRGVRWMDIRRLNLESANIILQRKIAGTFYTLPPNDPRTVILIPWDEINRSGIEQNPR